MTNQAGNTEPLRVYVGGGHEREQTAMETQWQRERERERRVYSKRDRERDVSTVRETEREMYLQ